MPLVTYTWRGRNISIFQQSLSLIVSLSHWPSWITCVLTIKYSCFLLLDMTSDPILALLELQIGRGLLLDSNGPLQGSWAQSIGMLYWPNCRQAENWRAWSVHFAVASYSHRKSQSRTSPASPISVLQVMVISCLVLVVFFYTHLSTPVPRLEPFCCKGLLNLPHVVWALLTG